MKRALLVGLVFLVAGCGQHARVVPKNAIALLGDEPILRADFDLELARAKRSYAATGRPFPQPGTDAYRRLKEGIVALLVDRTRVEIKARHENVRVTDAEIDHRLREFVRDNFGGDERRFQARLRQTGQTMAGVRDVMRFAILVDKVGGINLRSPKVTYAPGFEPAGGG